MEIKKKYRLLKLFGIYIAAIIFGLIPAILFKGTKIHAIVFYLVIAVGLYIYVKKENIIWQPWFGKVHKEGLVRIIISAICMLALIILAIALRTGILMEGTAEDFKFNIFLFISSCCLAPLIEEFLFRGIVFDILKEKHSNTFVVIVSSIIFYMAHGTPTNIGTLIFGLFAGWMIIKTKSIIPGVIIHFVWNTIIYFLPVIASNIANAI